MHTTNEKPWSPFDPEWYKKAFDKFISTADRLFNQQDIIDEGYDLPDADGSKSSVFRNELKLNNSFNEDALRKTLEDIYLNSSHKLIASNNDNVHFYQWHGTMNDVTYESNSDMCNVVLPTDAFLNNNRDKYKISQFYRKWITFDDIINNWDIFKWIGLLFINQRPYADYQIRIDDQKTTIRFRYYDFWRQNNYPIYFYKFDTNAQCCTKISRRQTLGENNWIIPVDSIPDKRVLNSNKVIGIFSRSIASSDRKDTSKAVDAMSDNIEFLKIQDDKIDISDISKRNKDIVYSDDEEYIKVFLIVPKFLHEFALPLPADIIYRSYRSDFQKVYAQYNGSWHNARIDNAGTEKNVYVNMDDNMLTWNDGWKKMIRPLVLSDAYEGEKDPYEKISKDLENISLLDTKAADEVEKFSWAVIDYTTDEDFLNQCDAMEDAITAVHDAYNKFMDNRWIDHNEEYDSNYDKFIDEMKSVRKDKRNYSGFGRQFTKQSDFWIMVSPLVYIPRQFLDNFDVIPILRQIDNKCVWEDKETNTIRFKHPIDTSNFWTFEYDHDLNVWRPYILDVERHYPDTYLFSDGDKDISNRVFKAFFFYSDTMNVRNKESSIYRPTPDWDDDMEVYEYEYGSSYRDIFMEKFYWMGIKSVYSGVLNTDYKFELLEYVIDNNSYKRFNDLFLNTMDPYFKMGLATYLRSDDYEFPFDYDIDKLNESIAQKFIGYEKVTNFERYLNNSWIPSYFDYITKILDDWDYSPYLVRRPRSSFDTTRLLPYLVDIQTNISTTTENLINDLDWILAQLNIEDYRLNVDQIKTLKDLVDKIGTNIQAVLEYTSNLDMDIYSIDDVNKIVSMLEFHGNLVNGIHTSFDSVYIDAKNKQKYDHKLDTASIIHSYITNEIHEAIEILKGINNIFDINDFMKITNDYDWYQETRDLLKDRSLIGLIDRFKTMWTNEIKDIRNRLVKATTDFSSKFKPDKCYSIPEINDLKKSADNIENDMVFLRQEIAKWWDNNNFPVDDAIVDAFEDSYKMIHEYVSILDKRIDALNTLIDRCDNLRILIVNLESIGLSDTEEEYLTIIDDSISDLISAFSYIAGTNDDASGDLEYEKIKSAANDELKFINHEQEVFERIYESCKSDNTFYSTATQYTEILSAIIDYMKTIDHQFIPDNQNPSYSIIYTPKEVRLITGGFNHNVGELVFVPQLGVYRISATEGNIATAIDITPMNYRNTIFRDPTWQSSNPYDGITNGSGMGISLRAIKSNETEIINDDALSTYKARVNNVLYLIRRDLDSINPYTNSSIRDTITNIENISDDYNELLSFYSDYLSDNAKSYMNELIPLSSSLIEPLNDLISIKENNDLADLINTFESLITTSYNYMKTTNKLTPTFNYFDNRIRTVDDALLEFYGNGSSWNDADELKGLFNTLEYELKLYKRKAPAGIDVQDILDLYDSILTKIDVFRKSIDKTIEQQKVVSEAIESVDNKLNEDVTFQHDVWYNIKNLIVGNAGSGYKVGDIVQITPELPTDILGNPIHDNEDIIMSDKLFAQVTQINSEGGVTAAQMLLDYALPYKIWGSRQTTAVAGNGSGLILNLYSYEITIKDSTLFLSSDSDPIYPDHFDQNDMFKFKFENIHDLPISYEVFYAGRQIYDFVLRHENDDNQLHPRKYDAIYLNANDVYDLRNSAIYINAQNYLVYKLDNVEIIDPGAGYEAGQEIVIDAGQLALRLKVAKLMYGPMKRIDSIEFLEDNIIFNGSSPASEHAEVVDDSVNNIDDEYHNTRYDRLTQDGEDVGASRILDPVKYPYHRQRLDDIEGGNRNDSYLYPHIDMPDGDEVATHGDPDDHFYLGSRTSDERPWESILTTIDPIDGIIPDEYRTPVGQPINGEYQYICEERICTHIQDAQKDNKDFTTGDLEVATYADLPKTAEDWPEVQVNKCVIVDEDETKDGHRTMYRVNTFIISGYIIYDLPEIVDNKWDHFHINWMNIDFYPDLPSLKAQYPDANWNDSKTYRQVERQIANVTIDQKVIPEKHLGTYITGLTVDDISVWNATTRNWEDLHDSNKWKLEVVDDEYNQDWGFTLTYLADGDYSYDMQLYLNKTPDTQTKNATKKENAVFKIQASIYKEVNTKLRNISVNTGRILRIRKLFPYCQKESYTLSANSKSMNFKLNKYNHFRNEIHLEDIAIYNKTAGRFENIMDPTMFTVNFKDPKAVSTGYETQTNIVRCVITESGSDFVDGTVWCWNEEYDIHVFGYVTADFYNDGHMLTLTPLHCPKPPKDDISLEFRVFQFATMSDIQEGLAVMEFQTQKIEVAGDGYIHNVTNPMAPITEEFQVIPQYEIQPGYEYDIIIKKFPESWTFIRPNWEVYPVFHLDDVHIPADRLYIMTDEGRFPLVNPSTGKPSLHVSYTDDGTDITYLNLYQKYDHFEVHTTPYPMKSVYTQRRVPSNGYIDTKGRINKPLNKKYFEFWMNGRLLFDEVTIISPTKLFLHGLTSLRNFEIIEINRDPNEYFSDIFLDVERNAYGSPYPIWKFNTYLDDALSGTLEGDNYTLAEQEALLSPVWKQVDRDDPNYKDYPENQDLEQDILLRIDEYQDMSDIQAIPYQFAIVDLPTIEGVTVTGRSLTWSQFGFIPMNRQMIVQMLNEEWADEINAGIAESHEIVSDDDWYGLATRLYDQYGILVHNLDESAYQIVDDNLLKINTSTKLARIVRSPIEYDLS